MVTLRNPLGIERSGRSDVVQLVANDQVRINLEAFQTFFRYVAYPE
jgi:hypothetical protein